MDQLGTTRNDLGSGFIEPRFLPPGQDEHYLRNLQAGRALGHWRELTAVERQTLIAAGSTADDWSQVRAAEGFRPECVRNCHFHGLVRIGRIDGGSLEHAGLRLPVGISDSRIVACDIGDNVAIHSVGYLAHYIVGDGAMLANIASMLTTSVAKFGNGIIKDGEDEKSRNWLEVINETGGRRVAPFEGQTPGDAYLWAKYRDDRELMRCLAEITQPSFDSRRGFYGTVGRGCVIADCGPIRDVKFGEAARVVGAARLENVSIDSSIDDPSEIGAGVELENGIVSCGCRAMSGARAFNFVLGQNSQLKLGARLVHSYLGDNSTIACCEVLHNLIFPSHEQHHNNSFLIASLVMGQSNLAAGATIGSNHNSRANDGEVQAGRGFWPGLCVSIKHNCRFASFTLLAKGDYPSELNVSLPFALVSNNVHADRLEIMPAYWWLYNMYALARNSWKFAARDRRKNATQPIEYDALAPDTAEEMLTARGLLEEWVGKAAISQGTPNPESTGATAASSAAVHELGCQLLSGPADKMAALEVLAEGVENAHRKTVILKAHAAYHAYGQMLHYYAVRSLLAYLRGNAAMTWPQMVAALTGPRETRWVNLGGQVVAGADMDALKADIREGRLKTWSDVHAVYARLWEKYPLDKARHALATLLEVHGQRELSESFWRSALNEAVAVQRQVAEQVYKTRKKDFDSPFRAMVYENAGEMAAVCGNAEDNSFVRQVRCESDEFAAAIEAILHRD